jgi:hypothetical protein
VPEVEGMIKHFCDRCGEEIIGAFCENIHIFQRFPSGILNDLVLHGEYHISCISRAIEEELEK